MGFSDLNSVKDLKKLALNPVDLTDESLMTSKRIDGMVIDGCGFKLLYGTERVDGEVVKTLCDLAQETQAVKQMHEMQKGAILNMIQNFPSEERSVLHTSMRDLFDCRQDTELALSMASMAYQELEKLKIFLMSIEKQSSFENVVQVGIGGSHLGPEAIYKALEVYSKKGKKAYFISNVDPDEAIKTCRALDLSKTLFVVVSKSGTTIETLTNEILVRNELKKQGLNPDQHIVSVTGKGSPMDDPSKYLASFYIWDSIGGRYSVTSMVGCVMLAFIMGMDRLLDFLRGAHAMDKIALEEDPLKNLPLFSSLLNIWNRNFLNHGTFAVIPYSQALSRYPAHLQQLTMESNGKSIDKKGDKVDFMTSPIVWGEPGTNGQHSFYQLIHQGTDIVPIEMLGFLENQYQEDVEVEGSSSQEKLIANMFAQSISLATGQKNNNPNKHFYGNRPNRILLAEKLTPFSMGAILSYHEHQVAFTGFIWGINSFDQEGVQLGKVLANKILSQMTLNRENKNLDTKHFPLGAAYLRHLSQF
ncbi:MAG: glucose-6-phosphate isomerase [Rhabdochlamydiaceae bacterium]